MREGSYREFSRELFMREAEKSGAIARARSRAASYAEAAARSLEEIKPSKHKDALRSIPSYILEREM
jgi:geranylgeranyl pyrophosphate synthase